MTLSDWLNLAVAFGTLSLALAAVYSALSAEHGRSLDARRRQVERVLDATVDLADAAAFRYEGGSEAALDVARRRLHAEIQMVGVTGYESTELMVRPQGTKETIAQAEAAFLEIGERMDEVASRSLLSVWLRRTPPSRAIVGGSRI